MDHNKIITNQSLINNMSLRWNKKIRKQNKNISEYTLSKYILVFHQVFLVYIGIYYKKIIGDILISMNLLTY